MLKLFICLVLVVLTLVKNVATAEIRVGVASNFIYTAKLLSKAYVAKGNEEPILLFGSTGKHAAQIRSGLKIDLLLAADSKRPADLLADRFGMHESLETYALGNLIFWFSADLKLDKNIEELIAKMCETDAVIAIANPLLAPYGVASKEVLAAVSGGRPCEAQIVVGENVAQVAHFANTGSVSAAFLPKAMAPYMLGGSSFDVPNELHSPIEQKMILLSASLEALKFYRFILSDEGRSIIRSNGYDLKHD